MRDRAQTVAKLENLAARPGTPQEGETARRKLKEQRAKQVDEMVYSEPVGFDASRFPAGTVVYYNSQISRPNRRAVVMDALFWLDKKEQYFRMRFDDRHSAATVCVHFNGKTYISAKPLDEDELRVLHGMAWE